MWGLDRKKNPSWGLLSGITGLAEWCLIVIPRDGFFYLFLKPILDAFSCIPFISEDAVFSITDVRHIVMTLLWRLVNLEKISTLFWVGELG